MGGLEEELTEVSVGVVWLFVHVGGGSGGRTNSWNTWQTVSSPETWTCSPLFLQICLFIMSSLGSQKTESQLSLNKNRDDFNVKKNSYSNSHGSSFVRLEQAGMCGFLFPQYWMF